MSFTFRYISNNAITWITFSSVSFLVADSRELCLVAAISNNKGLEKDIHCQGGVTNGPLDKHETPFGER